MSSQPSLTLPSLGKTFGALFVDATIAVVLYGIMNLQVLMYYTNYPNDWYATTQPAIYTFYSMVITADLIIALIMCYYLHKSRVVMRFSSMADLLLCLIRLVIRSGLTTR
ncbi:hypothetical protein EDD85DRAFT_944993 [Armillaria nabsnona]|nr:hypothetical protein EDD85DRAFT_944993 [Armillaria nabsnona]